MSRRKYEENKFGRRALLRGGIGLGVISPFLPILEADAMAGSPKRVCFITTPNGVSTQVVPTGSATNYQFRSVLAPLEAHKADITYLHGIDLKTWTTNKIPNDHPPVVNQLLTAADSINPNDGSDPAVSSSWLSSGTSIDQFIAQRLMLDASTSTKFASIVAGVETSAFAWKQVFTGPGEAIFPEINATNLHARIFDGVTPGGSGGPDPALVRRLAEQQSVIDSVRAELNSVLSKVSSNDKRKIEAHLEAIREIERRLTFDEPPSGGDGAACSIPQMRGEDSGTGEDRYRKKGENMMDVIAHAFACDQTRVATLQWENGASGQSFPSKGINESHHNLTHDNFTANAGKRAKVSEWYAERLLYFIEKLKSIPEGSGTLLDNTLLVWTSEHSDDAQHGRTNIPFTLAGSLGGTIQTGRFLDFSANSQAHNDVYVSVAQGMGLTDVTSFGKASLSNGPLPGLLV